MSNKQRLEHTISIGHIADVCKAVTDLIWNTDIIGFGENEVHICGRNIDYLETLAAMARKEIEVTTVKGAIKFPYKLYFVFEQIEFFYLIDAMQYKKWQQKHGKGEQQ